METSEQAAAITQVRDDGGLDRAVDNEGDENGQILDLF